MFLLADEIFAYADIFIGKIALADGYWPVVHAGFAQILTIQRTIDGNFAFRAAADRADVALYARTVPFRAPFLTQLAKDIHA